MQNRYVGDIGDFGKYGLLRALFGLKAGQFKVRPFRLGIVWYMHPDESHNADGRYTGYLDPTPQTASAFRSCDPQLYDSLQKLVASGQRHIANVRRIGILPSDAEYYELSLSYPRDQSRSSRQSARLEWLNGALEATVEAEIVFIDPDNGISETVDPLRKNGPKYVFISDLREFTARGQTLVIYHHLGRQGTAVEQIRRVSKSLQTNLALARKPWALWYHRGTVRAYFIVPQERHRSVLENRLASFLNGPWSKHFELVD